MKYSMNQKRTVISHLAAFLAIAMCFASIAMLLSGCTFTSEASDGSNKSGNSPLTPNKANEIEIGYNEDASKELPSQRIALKCYSYYPFGEKITVKASMGDEYTYFQKHNILPSYDTYGNNGFPVFEVHPYSYPTDDSTKHTYVRINGNSDKYTKVFQREDMPKLDISESINAAMTNFNYSEDVVLDMSDCYVGETGTIAFTFGWRFDTPPYEGFRPEDLFIFMRRCVYYYVGKDGVYIGFNSEESTVQDAVRSSGQGNGEASATVFIFNQSLTPHTG